MSYIPLERIIDKADGSLYKLVILAAKRSLELSEGMPKLVEADQSVKYTTIALQEIAEDKIRYKKG